jgi:hypothetical protein
MRIKSYFANSVTDAINRARMELGQDAMIIASNRTTAEAERLGLYEVVFGVADTTPAAEPQKAPPAASEGLERLRARMEELRKSVAKKREHASLARVVPAGPKIVSSLVAAGFPETAADDFAKALQVRSRGEKHSPAEALGTAIGQCIRFNAKLGAGGPGRSTVALVGPARRRQDHHAREARCHSRLSSGSPSAIHLDRHTALGRVGPAQPVRAVDEREG